MIRRSAQEQIPRLRRCWQQILDAVVEVLAPDDFDRARMSDIAELPRVVKGTSYNYFESVQQLRAAVGRAPDDRPPLPWDGAEPCLLAGASEWRAGWSDRSAGLDRGDRGPVSGRFRPAEQVAGPYRSGFFAGVDERETVSSSL